MKITTYLSRIRAGQAKPLFCVSFLALMLVSPLLAANSSAERIQALIAEGKLQQALAMSDKELLKDSGNTTHRFLKGLILTKLNRLSEARDLFIAMTEQHPDLPEPYNNLAVIYAAQGDFDKAREALQRAINTHPSYATAHENMGDIYAKMAVMAYSEALQLDSGNQTAREKLSLVSELFSIKAKEQMDMANAKQAEAEKAIARLAVLEQDLASASAEAKREQVRSKQLRAELSALEKETAKAVEQARQQQVQAEQQAKLAERKVEKARVELSELKQMRSDTADEARRMQQQAEQQAKLAQLQVEQSQIELKELQSKQAQLSQQSRQQQQQALQQAKLSEAKVEQARAELGKLKSQLEKTSDEARQQQREFEQQASEAQAKVQQANMELSKLKAQQEKTMAEAKQQQAMLEQQAAETQAKVAQAKLELEQLEQERIRTAELRDMELAKLEQAKLEQSRQTQAEVDKARKELERIEQEKQRAAEQRQAELAKLEAARAQQQAGQAQAVDRDAVTAAVMDWAARWSAQDVEGYLSFYATDFTPGRGLSLNQWRAQRRQRLTRPSFIKVGLSDVEVVFYGNEHAQVSFNQSYQSDTYRDRGQKTLLMKNVSGNWRIVEERSN